MKNIQFGVGTYIVREEAQKDLSGTLAKLEAIGYDGAELLGLYNKSPEEILKDLTGKAISIFGDHINIEAFSEKPQEAITQRLRAGCGYVTIGITKEQAAKEPFEKIAEDFGKAADACHAGGIIPLYHNHDFDMQGHMPLAERILDAVPALSYEPDLGWMFVAAQDIQRLLLKYKSRTPVVHLKDVFVTKDSFTFRPTGYGNLNTAQYMEAVLACAPKWLVVDHDLAYGRNSYEDLAISLQYIRNLLRVMQ